MSSSVQFSSVAQLCLTLCDPMNRSTPALPVHHQLPESTQIHVHWVGDAIQSSHPLSFPFYSCPQSFPVSRSFQMNQLFAAGGQSIGVSASTSVLPMNTQYWSPLGWTGRVSLQSSSVQFSHSVMSDSLQPHESQHTSPPCPSPTPGVHSDSRPSSAWCHPAISSSVIPFSSWPQSLPASGSFPMSQLFAWGGQSTGSSLASFLPMKPQGWSPSEWTGWISLQSKGLSRVFSNTTLQKHEFFSAQPSSQSNSHIHTWVLEKP